MDNQKFLGKKLLILGSSLGADSMVKYAKSCGCYVIVADYLPTEQSSAKKLADQAVMISTQDFDALEKFAKETKVDGVFCGVSEINLLAVRELCTRLNLPCYFTKEQWDLCQEKRRFKRLCIENDVPVPREFLIDFKTMKGIGDVKYPVIVKPVDGSAAKGITICHSEDELLHAIPIALQESKKKEYLVEEYVIGREYTSVYTISNGKIALSCLRDRFPTLDHENVTAQFDMSLSPSLYKDRYIKNVHPHVVRMLERIGAKNGCVFFQGIVNEEKMVIFECGYRMNALLDYYNISNSTHENYMEMLINYALTGNMGEDVSDIGIGKFGYWCIFNMSCHGGKIARLEGDTKCMKIPGIIHCEFLLPVGKSVEENNSMAQSVFRAFINAPTLAELKNIIDKIQKTIIVEDVAGNNLLFLPFDINRLNEYAKLV